MSHICAGDGAIAHYLEAEMSVYPHIFLRMGFKIRLSSVLFAVFEHRSEKFTDKMLSLRTLRLISPASSAYQERKIFFELMSYLEYLERMMAAISFLRRER